jgi:hypothetical protein
MRRFVFLISCMPLLVCAAQPVQRSAAESAQETGQWVQLFDGKSLAGWVTEPASQAKQFSVRNGVIHVEGSPQGGWLRTDRKYSDFTMRFEVRYLSPDHIGNSGLILRSPEISISGRNWPGRGFEMELRDMNNKVTLLPPEGTILALQPGAPSGKFAFDTEAAARAYRPTGEWNQVEIIAHGNRMWTKLNGEWLATAYNVAHPDGHIGFQAEDGIVEYRNLSILEHGPDALTPETYVPFFDGELMNMRVSDPQYQRNVTVENGILRLSGQGGWLKSTTAYTNYTLRLEFRTLTADADSGVYLRVGDDDVDQFGWPLDTTEAQLRHQQVPPPTGAPADRRWIGAILRRGDSAGGLTTIDTSAVLSAYRGLNTWQEAVIEVNGRHVTWKLNGTVIGEGDNVANPAGGHVGIQIGPGTIEFRRIEIKGSWKD